MSAAEIPLIQRVILDFALRDRNDWSAVANLFAPAAQVKIAWYDGPIEGFLKASAESAARGAPLARPALHGEPNRGARHPGRDPHPGLRPGWSS